MNVVVRTLAAVAVVCLLVPVATAQDRDWWRETAARDAQRAREAQRAEFIRAQYERRRSMAHARLRSDQSSTLYASTLSAADVQLSCPVEPAPGMHNVIELVIDGRHDNPVSSAGGTLGRPGLAATYDWPGIFSPVVLQAGPAWDFDTVHGGHLVSENRGATASAGTAAAHGLPFLPSASDAHGRDGIAHVLNRSAEAGEVRIVAVDDSGRRYGPLRFFLGANETVHVSSDDLENGNADKGLFGATGPGVGDWRLELSSDLDIEALSYVRASDGWVTAMHDVAPREGTRHRVPFFNPASDFEQASRLRLINPGHAPAEVAITGIDSRGTSPGDGVAVTIPAGASLTYTAAELESGRGAGLRGSLGDGTGEWRLIVESEQPLQAMSLVSSPTGHLTNLSTAPPSEARVNAHQVPLFPATSDPLGRQGLVRVVNRTDTAGEVHVKAHDDTQWDYAPLELPIAPGESVQFDSNDMEQGNPARGFSGGTGSGQGDWRLELSSDIDIEVLSYVRAWDGLLAPMHDVVPSEAEGTRHRVAMFGPEGSSEQERVLRLINPGNELAEVAISGVDALGRSLGDGVAVTLPAGASRTYTAEELQTGEGIGLRGSLGDGTDEWRLTVESQQPLQVMSLLSGPSGHLSNLSTAPVLVPKTLPPVFATDTETTGEETAEDVFRTAVSPIVQAQCIVCHRSGGFPADVPNSRLQFNPATVEGHVELNLAVIEAFLAVLGDDEDVEDPATYILNKVQGVGHGGGLQLTAGTDNYASLERFLGLLGEAVAPVGITPETLFEGVTMESPQQTLRRAAIVFAGRVPTDAEYAAIEGAGDEEEDTSEEQLRGAIRGLMTGPGFHEFLIRASNDRLLTDRHLQDHTIENNGYFVDFDNEFYRLAAMEDRTAHNGWENRVQYGAGRAPLELIAHVVENDLPYTEILTADYVMANPWAAQAYGASTMFDDPTDVHEFRPAEILSYYRHCEGKITEFTPGIALRVLDPGPCSTDFPHAGILNTKVFLKRYPTTATNRNRARSRWTYYHFLGLDIEKSASRTADPVALADTNNPTMNNSACTVCHTIMDPVAGAFQNYGDVGFYRDQGGGLDSLDPFYKDRSGTADDDFAVTARSWLERQTVSRTAELAAGGETVRLKIINENDPENRNWSELALDQLTVRDADGTVVMRHELERSENRECGSPGYNEATGHEDYYHLQGGCPFMVSVDVPNDGSYAIDVVAWILDQGEGVEGEPAILEVALGFFREGDTWYRDMREPGFDGELVPNADNSLQWLAQQIVADDRFAEAAVRFWWPAIIGAEVAEPPEDETDADFDGLLLASNSQAAEVTRLADGFRSGFHEGTPYNLKDLLVEIVLSGWFRAESVSEDDPLRATGLGSVGAKRLLTPEELARKTLALTRFQWGRGRNDFDQLIHEQQWGLLTDSNVGYGLLYGGIDSDGITERATEFTALMAGVAQSHALETSCPVVMRELYLLPNEQRALFTGVDKTMSPTYEFGETFSIAASTSAAKKSFSLRGRMSAGSKTASLAFLNDSHSEEQGDRNVRLDRLEVRNAAGEIADTVELEQLERASDCNHPVDDHFALHCSGSLHVPFTVPADGEYTIAIVAWADQGGDELPELEITLHSDTENSPGARAIKGKLVELFNDLLGIQVPVDSPEIRDAYDLFVEVWERKRDSQYGQFSDWGEGLNCNWSSDHYFLDGIVDNEYIWREDWGDDGGARWDFDWDRINEHFETIDWSDSQGVARTWVVVLAYLMTDYRYLYL